MSTVAAWSDQLFWGALVILRLFACALLMTVAWGLLGAAAKLSASRIARRLASLYTTVLRGTPELLVLLIVYFGSAVTLTALVRTVDPAVKFVDIPPFWAGAFAISLVIGAYATETFRGAFLGIDHGQVEAGRALGLTPLRIFVHIRLPQMWRLALPTFGNHMVSLMKDTALVSVIGLEEIMYTAEMAMTLSREPFTVYAFVAVIYLAFTSAIIAGVWALERRANRHLRGVR